MNEINELSETPSHSAQKKEPSSNKKEKESEGSLPPIIKKIKKKHHGHHGGAWKIAFADFVTAMMAFFLLMWLIASLNKAQKAGISEYFKQPMKVALFGGDSMGNRQINVKGGGPDIQDVDGQVSATTKPLKDEKSKQTVLEVARNENKKLQQLKSEINLSMEKDPALQGLKKQLLMDIVSDGLRIQLIDNQKKPMFEVGSDQINPEMIPVLENIVKLLNASPNKITIQGHTDAHPYQNPEELDYTNWELSTQRANAARRALVKAGLDEHKVMTVSGFSSTVLLNKDNPTDDQNRRISIIVMKKDVENKVSTNQ